MVPTTMADAAHGPKPRINSSLSFGLFFEPGWLAIHFSNASGLNI
jgi:hypothetical protein